MSTQKLSPIQVRDLLLTIQQKGVTITLDESGTPHLKGNVHAAGGEQLLQYLKLHRDTIIEYIKTFVDEHGKHQPISRIIRTTWIGPLNDGHVLLSTMPKNHILQSLSDNGLWIDVSIKTHD